jgi:Cdc6-like AAA superfamily ATPase
MDVFERVQEFDECEYVGPVVFEDMDGRKFFAGARVHNMVVSIGDLVRVVLEGGDEGADDGDGESLGFCQVLSIYDENDSENGEGVHFEARWLIPPEELDQKKRKLLTSELPNELVETDVLDDIPIGSVSGHIRLVGPTESKSKTKALPASLAPEGKFNDEEVFVCRYLSLEGTASLQPVHLRRIFARGSGMSHYQYAYVQYLASLPPTDERCSTYTGGSGNKSAKGSKGGAESAGADRAGDIYSQAIRRLHLSVLPEKLPCRKNERDFVYNALRDVISTRAVSKPIYISGMPGTGKTATVLATVQELKAEAEKGLLPDFDFLEINCLRLQSPAQAYTVLWRGMTGMHASPEKALKLLGDRFENAAANHEATKSRRVFVCLVDEMDFLMTRNDEIVYTFFNWPQLKDSLIAVVGIANVMDLPERLASRTASRFQLSMSRIIFPAYEFAQIQQILKARLEELKLTFLNDTALGLISRKAAIVAGDLRAALKISQRVIELFRDQEEREKRRADRQLEAAAESAAHAAAAEAALLNKIWTDMPAGTHVGDVLDAPGRDNSSSTQHSAAAVPQLPPKKGIMALIKQATDEYKESPMMATVSRLCALDRAIVIGACKHVRATESKDISAEELRMRLDDLLAVARNAAVNSVVVQPSNQVSGQAPAQAQAQHTSEGRALPPLSPPPQHIFNEAIRRLGEQGILVDTKGKGRAGRGVVGAGVGAGAGAGTGAGAGLEGGVVYSFRLELSDVVAALSDLYQRKRKIEESELKEPERFPDPLLKFII